MSACSRDQQAEGYTVEAIQVAIEAGNHPSALNALATFDLICMGQERNASAMEMVLFVLGHSSSTQDAKARAERLSVELEKKLTADELEDIRIQASSNTWNTFISSVPG